MTVVLSRILETSFLLEGQRLTTSSVCKYTRSVITLDNPVPSSEFNRLNHTVGLLSRKRREVRTYSPHHGISLTKRINPRADILRQNHVIINGGI
jgi:hypothetical protein